MAALTYPYKSRYILYSIWHPNWHFVETPYSHFFQTLSRIFANKRCELKTESVLIILPFSL